MTNKENTNQPTSLYQNPLFNFIHPFDNENFFNLSSTDLHQLLKLLDNYLLEYRPQLDIPNDFSFGIEIELEKKLSRTFFTKNHIETIINHNIIKKDYDWLCVADHSLGTNGLEINSPILRDEPDYWHDLFTCCKFLNIIGYIDEKCGGHIHAGAHLFNDDSQKWLNFLKIWTVYENIIIRFTNGAYLNARPGITQYAEPISKKTWEKIRQIHYQNIPFNEAAFLLLKEYQQDKYQAVNFQHVNFTNRKKYGNTIEFRCPNGTLNPIIWQNNINLILNIINTCLSNNAINENILLQRWFNLQNTTPENPNYNHIYLQQALEFCDLIFHNNLDKLYFLKQYLKNYNTTTQKHLAKAHEFTTVKSLIKKSKIQGKTIL